MSGPGYGDDGLPTTEKFTLFHADGAGSTFALAVLTALNVPHEVVVVDFDAVTTRESSDPEDESHPPELRRLLRANPLAQFPTLLTPDGTVMTETAAIALYLHDNYAQGTPWSISSLSASQLAVFYRVMVYIPANIYPLITIIDFPERFITIPPSSHILEHISVEAITGWVGERAITNRMNAFKLLEWILVNEATRWGVSDQSPFALGTPAPTLVDVYITLIAHYSPRPRYAWLKEHCPRIFALGSATLENEVIRGVFQKQSFDGEPWPTLAVEETIGAEKAEPTT